jgi:hypothetical protein
MYHSLSHHFLDRLQDVEHVAPQSVEFPHDHGVAVADVVHQSGESRAVVARAGHDVREGLCDPGGLEGGVLLLECLGDGADPGVADARPGGSPNGVCHMSIEWAPATQRLEADFCDTPTTLFPTRTVQAGG